MELNHDKLIEYLDYNPDTGIFTWLKNPGIKNLVGKEAGCVNSIGYVNMSIFGKKYSGHRLAWFYCFREWPVYNIDHIDKNRSNNRLDNLRDVPQSLNIRNTQTKLGQSGRRGVYKSGNKWKAASEHYGKYVYLGTYDTIEEAGNTFDTYTEKQYENFT